MFAEFWECVVEFEIELRECTRLGTGVAPTVSGAVVCADTGEGLDLLLNQNPIKRVVAKAVLNDDGRAALARAIDVELVSAEVDELAQ
jgi:hypothetical protein